MVSRRNCKLSPTGRGLPSTPHLAPPLVTCISKEVSNIFNYSPWHAVPTLGHDGLRDQRLRDTTLTGPLSNPTMLVLNGNATCAQDGVICIGNRLTCFGSSFKSYSPLKVSLITCFINVKTWYQEFCHMIKNSRA